MNCGCQFNLPSTHGHCQTAYVGTIAEGHFNGTPLACLIISPCSGPTRLCSESCETLFLPIDLEANSELRTAKVDIPGIMKSTGRPIINEFNGQPFHVALARPSGSFEFTYAEIGLGTTSVTGGLEMAFEDSWAHYCVHHYNQNGLVRPAS